MENNLSLEIILFEISSKCTNCKDCVKACAFLYKYGTPKEIADRYDPGNPNHRTLPFECTLCRLCEAVCPVKINPGQMFLAMRREAVKNGAVDLRRYKKILNYEKRGISNRFTYYHLPDNCDTIFFPGCSLPGTRPDKTLWAYHYLQSKIESLGIIFDCCMTPSHNLGRQGYFEKVFFKKRDFILQQGVKKVIVACPNCHQILMSYGGDLIVKTIYEFMADNNVPVTSHGQDEVTIHDPCALRFKKEVHDAVRRLIKSRGLTISEMPSHGHRTLCCGEGGTVEPVSPQMTDQWRKRIRSEADGRNVITYCAGCVKSLSRLTDITHILDLGFDSVKQSSSMTTIYRTPIPYLNRLWLISKIKKENKKHR